MHRQSSDFTKQGWIEAERLKSDDYVMRMVWEAGRDRQYAKHKQAQSVGERMVLLLKRMLCEGRSQEGCLDGRTQKKASEHMKKINAEYHSQIMERMTKNNPMKNPDTRAKVSKRLKEIGHHPKIRCGNGQGLTVPQQNFAIKLADFVNVYTEYPIPTKMSRDSGYPTCYKADIAIPEKMIAIEIDGKSHCTIARQEQDKKKDAFLNGLGWKVLRFKNKQVMEHLGECVAMVMSIISK